MLKYFNEPQRCVECRDIIQVCSACIFTHDFLKIIYKALYIDDVRIVHSTLTAPKYEFQRNMLMIDKFVTGS